MKSSIILICAVNACLLPCSAVDSDQLAEASVIAPKAQSFPLVKVNIEGILVNEPEKKRRYTASTGSKHRNRFNAYGRRAAYPSKATLKKRNKKR